MKGIEQPSIYRSLDKTALGPRGDQPEALEPGIDISAVLLAAKDEVFSAFNNLWRQGIVQLQSEGKLPDWDDSDQWNDEARRRVWRVCDQAGVNLGLWKEEQGFEYLERQSRMPPPFDISRG